MKIVARNIAAVSIAAMAALLTACGVLPLSSLTGQDGTQPPTQSRALGPRGDTSNYRVFYRFHGPDGALPYASLSDVQGTLYGTTEKGGTARTGTIFTLTTGGSEKTLYSFESVPDGALPETGLIDAKGTLYGTTREGGNSVCYYSLGCGTVYSVSTAGAEKVLYAFDGPDDGEFPVGLIDVHGTLYGTTSGILGDLGCAYHNLCGTVFSLTTSGKETVVHRFGGPTTSDGLNPEAGLIDVNGTLYGTTAEGGVYSGSKRQCNSEDCGTVFSITTSGKEKVLHSFGNGSDGLYPFAGLVNVNGTLYGTTSHGGAHGLGTVFSITTSGKEKVLYSFAGGTDGSYPEAGLIEAGGTLYGTTIGGGGSHCLGDYGQFGCGTVYSINPSGAETVLHSFTGGSDGGNPRAALLDVDGVLYGTTTYGGLHSHKCNHPPGCGTVFALTP